MTVPQFPSACVMAFFVLGDFRKELIVCSVDICGGIVDHYLNKCY